MQPPLLLDFSAADARGLGGIVWKAAFVLWVPQLLAVALVLYRRRRRSLSRSAEVTRLLIPFILFVCTLCSVPALTLILLMYSDVHWGLWLLVLWLPTLAGIVLALATNTTPPAPAPKQRPSRLVLLSGAVLLVGTLLTLLQRCQEPAESPLPTPHEPFPRDDARLKAQARQDSLRFLEQWEQKRRPTQPW